MVMDGAAPSGSGAANSGGDLLRSAVVKVMSPAHAPPCDAPASGSGMRKGMLSITSHFSLCIIMVTDFGLLFHPHVFCVTAAWVAIIHALNVRQMQVFMSYQPTMDI